MASTSRWSAAWSSRLRSVWYLSISAASPFVKNIFPTPSTLTVCPGDGPLWATQTVGTPSRQVPCGGPLAIGRPSHALSELPLSFADRFVDAPWFRDQVEGRTSEAG